MMAWGDKCADWHDSVDQASLEQHGFEIKSDDDLVITTWHDDEAIDEVFWFSEFCADHPTKKLGRTLIIDVCEDTRRDFILGRYNEAIRT
jgi:hypothetical protein